MFTFPVNYLSTSNNLRQSQWQALLIFLQQKLKNDELARLVEERRRDAEKKKKEEEEKERAAVRKQEEQERQIRMQQVCESEIYFSEPHLKSCIFLSLSSECVCDSIVIICFFRFNVHHPLLSLLYRRNTGTLQMLR